MKVQQVIYTLHAFTEGRTSFANTLRVLLQNTNWTDGMFAVYFGVELPTFQQWLDGENLPSPAEQQRYIASITEFMNIDIRKVADMLSKLEQHQKEPNNDAFVVAMQSLDFMLVDKDLLGKVVFGPHVKSSQTGSTFSNYKRRRGLPKRLLQKDITENAMRAIEMQILTPFEHIRHVGDVESLPRPKIVENG